MADQKAPLVSNSWDYDPSLNSLSWCGYVIALTRQGVAFAQMVSVPFNERGFLFNTAPTLTFLWPAQRPRVTLIFIPGGEGRIEREARPFEVDLNRDHGTSTARLAILRARASESARARSEIATEMAASRRIAWSPPGTWVRP